MLRQYFETEYLPLRVPHVSRRFDFSQLVLIESVVLELNGGISEEELGSPDRFIRITIKNNVII